MRGDFGQPNGGFHRLDLAEEGPDARERIMAPVLQQARRLRRDLPLIRVWQPTSLVHVAADLTP